MFEQIDFPLPNGKRFVVELSTRNVETHAMLSEHAEAWRDCMAAIRVRLEKLEPLRDSRDSPVVPGRSVQPSA